MAVLGSEEWILAALRALGRDGVQGVRVEVLAKELGVTKGSFYHHFSKRQDLLDAMVAVWRQLSTERVIEETDTATDDPAERLLELAKQVFGETGGYDNVDAAIRDWAAVSAPVAAAVAEVDARRLTYVRDLLVGAGVPAEVAEDRANLMYRALIGEFTWRRYGGPRLSLRALDDLVGLLLTGRSEQGDSHDQE